MARAIEIIRKIAPHARPEYLAAFEQGDALLLLHGINSPARLAHFLAQCLAETGGLTILWENGNYRAPRILEIFGEGHHSAKVTPAEAERLAGNGPALFERVYGRGNPEKARQLGNTRPGDGWRCRGGGILQTTGGDNYRRMGVKCGVDFYGHPELIVSAEHALKPALIEWTEGNLNAYADKGDILSISRVINIGNAKTTKIPNGFADRQEWFAKVRPLIVAVTFDVRAAPSTPASPPAVPAAPSKPENTAAGGIVVAGGVLAGTAKAFGADTSTAIAIVIIVVIAAAVIWAVVKYKGSAKP